MEENPDHLSEMIERLCVDCKPYGLTLNIEKTKTMVFGERNIRKNLKANGGELQNIEEFTCLGSTITHDPDCKREVTLRFAKAKSVLVALGVIWKSKEISLGSIVDILRICVFSSALYACETWIITKETQRRVLAFDRICYRKVLRIGWRQKMRNCMKESN